MLLINPIGGLASQLHKYFIVYALSKRLDTKIKLYIDPKRKEHDRELELDKFNIDIAYASTIEITYFAILSKITKYLRKIGIKPKNYNFMGLLSYEDFIHSSDNTYLSKEWILGDIYYRNIYSELSPFFRLKAPMSKQALEDQRLISNCNSVSIHFRRGDYLNPETATFHGNCTLDYYYQAIDIIKKHVADPVLFIFSDEIEWVKNHFHPECEIHFINHSTHEDIILMSLCKHNIIANSGYSWMASCFNANPEKIIIAPRKWVNNDEISNKIYSYLNTTNWHMI